MRIKKVLRILMVAAFGISWLAVAVSGESEAAAAATEMSSTGLAMLGAALSTGLACIGAGISVGNTAAAAIGALTEDPTTFGKSLIFVVMGEGIALYGMLISIIIIFV